MSWSRSSKAGLAALLLLCAAVAPAGAVSVSPSGVPDSAEVGQQVSTTYTFEELYQAPPSAYSEWILRGETELREVSWTVTAYDLGGNQVSRETYNGQGFNLTVAQEQDVSRIDVEVTGTVPQVESYSYDPAQRFTLASFTQVQEGGTSAALGEPTRVHHYTSDSQAARNAIDEAATAVEAADSEEASRLLNSAISAYEAGNFDNAIDIAGQAQDAAESAQQSQQTRQLLLYGVAALAVLLLVGGGIYYYLANRETNDPLS